MRVIKISLISFVLTSLAACTTISDKYGFFKDESKSYQKAKPIERTVVMPQNLRVDGIQDYYEVPQAPEQTGTVPSLIPPGSHLIASKPAQTVLSQQDRIRSAENAKIQGHTSSAANAPQTAGVNFSQAWVKVGHVLQASNYKIVEKDKVLGTYYVIDTHSSGGKVKKDMPIYQVNLKASGNSTVITVSPANSSLQTLVNQSLND